VRPLAELHIAVTGLNASDNPGPGVPVIRSLREIPGFRGKIIGLIYDTLEPGAYIPSVADRIYMIPYPSSGARAIVERLTEIHAREQLDFILPTLDTEIYAYQQIAPRLRELGIRSLLPTAAQNAVRGKDQLAAFCREHGINVPRTELIHTEAELQAAVGAVGFPAVIKGIFYDAAVCGTADEARAAFYRLRAKWGLPIIVQQYLAGAEFNVTALGDGHGRTIGSVAMRKLTITDKGKGWAGVTIHDPELTELTQAVITKLSWAGGMELEFVKEHDTGKFYLLEINPRFPAWVYLATAAGQNMPAAMAALACDQPVADFDRYEVGKVFVRYSWDEITDMSKLEQLTMQRRN
jgi:carbamoyl-phosphate synthase large subunit